MLYHGDSGDLEKAAKSEELSGYPVVPWDFTGQWAVMKKTVPLTSSGVVGLFSNLMGQEAGRRGKLLERHEHRRE